MYLPELDGLNMYTKRGRSLQDGNTT